jgi:hypothetical protein
LGPLCSRLVLIGAASVRLQFSSKGLDVGMDMRSPVDLTFKLPLAFAGKIEKVRIDLGEA